MPTKKKAPALQKEEAPRKSKKADKPFVPSPIAWYVGYEVPEEDRDDVVKIASKIHRLRRSIAVASYQYYELDDSTITDHEYESRVLELHYLQLRYPKIASTVLFMPRAFSGNSFASTGYHIPSLCRSGDFGGDRIPSIATNLLNRAREDKDPVYQSPDVAEKIRHFSDQIEKLKKLRKSKS